MCLIHRIYRIFFVFYIELTPKHPFFLELALGQKSAPQPTCGCLAGATAPGRARPTAHLCRQRGLICRDSGLGLVLRKTYQHVPSLSRRPPQACLLISQSLPAREIKPALVVWRHGPRETAPHSRPLSEGASGLRVERQLPSPGWPGLGDQTWRLGGLSEGITGEVGAPSGLRVNFLHP